MYSVGEEERRKEEKEKERRSGEELKLVGHVGDEI